MEDWIIKGLVGVFLVVNAWLDWKRQEISLVTVGIFGAAGLGLNLCWHYQSWGSILAGGFLGLGMMFLSFLTKEAVGMGDGLILLVTGIFLGFAENFQMLFIGSALCSFLMCILLLLRRIWKDSRFPLVPFLLAAYVGRLLI